MKPPPATALAGGGFACLVALCAMFASSCSGPAGQADSAVAAAGASTSVQPKASGEQTAVDSGDAVRVVGDTLSIRAKNGKTVTFVTNPKNGDMQVTYTYVGKTAHGTLHQVDVQGWENSWTQYVHAGTGQVFNTSGEPLFSPDGKRMASSAYVMHICEVTARLEIYRLTDTLPALEFEIEPRDCIAETGWAPRELKWHSPDTLAFLADSNGVTGARMLAVRDGNEWRIVPQP